MLKEKCCALSIFFVFNDKEKETLFLERNDAVADVPSNIKEYSEKTLDLFLNSKIRNAPKHIRGILRSTKSVTMVVVLMVHCVISISLIIFLQQNLRGRFKLDAT